MPIQLWTLRRSVSDVLKAAASPFARAALTSRVGRGVGSDTVESVPNFSVTATHNYFDIIIGPNFQVIKKYIF